MSGTESQDRDRRELCSALQRALLTFVSGLPQDELARFTDQLERVLAASPTQELRAAAQRLYTEQPSWGYHAPLALVRAIHHTLCEHTLSAASTVRGADRLVALQSRKVILLCNHLSFSDAHVLQELLRRGGLEGEAERLTVIAGPKVFDDPGRRLGSAAFGLIKTPQSQVYAVGTAALPVREIARLAQASIECARERLERGDLLLIFPEGTRSRTQAMQSGLAAVARYFEPGAVLVPVALMGSQDVMMCADDRLRRATVSLTIGEPIEVEELERDYGRSPQRRVDAACRAIARLLDPEYQGVYAADC